MLLFLHIERTEQFVLLEKCSVVLFSFINAVMKIAVIF